MTVKIAALVCLLAATTAKLSLTAVATSPRTPPFPVSISVTVTNFGQAASSEATVVVWLKPRFSYGTRPPAEPVILEQDVPVLQPGEKRNFTLETPYAASSQVLNRTGNFSANNLGPTLVSETPVDFAVSLRER